VPAKGVGALLVGAVALGGFVVGAVGVQRVVITEKATGVLVIVLLVLLGFIAPARGIAAVPAGTGQLFWTGSVVFGDAMIAFANDFSAWKDFSRFNTARSRDEGAAQRRCNATLAVDMIATLYRTGWVGIAAESATSITRVGLRVSSIGARGVPQLRRIMGFPDRLAAITALTRLGRGSSGLRGRGNWSGALRNTRVLPRGFRVLQAGEASRAAQEVVCLP